MSDEDIPEEFKNTAKWLNDLREYEAAEERAYEILAEHARSTIKRADDPKGG